MNKIELLSAVPVSSVADLRRRLAFYRDRMKVEVAFDIGMYAGVRRDGVDLHLDPRTHEYASRPAGCRFHIRGVDALYDEMEHEDFIKPDERLATKHMRQFSVVDPECHCTTPVS